MRNAIRMAGFGGQGVVLASYILGKAACIHSTLRAAMTQNYGPESRGGACAADLVVEEKEISLPVVQQPDILVLMSQEAANKYKAQAAGARLVLIDEDLVKFDPPLPNAEALPFTRTADKMGKRIVANLVMLGALAARTELVGRAAIEEAIKSTVPKGTEGLNLKAFDAGFKLGERA